MGIINWLWEHTIAPESQETAIAESYAYEARSQEWASENYHELAAQEGKQVVDEYLLDCMQQRNRLRSERSALRITDFGRQFYRDNWQHYREMYPEWTHLPRMTTKKVSKTHGRI
jgi:hypothetical protein